MDTSPPAELPPAFEPVNGSSNPAMEREAAEIKKSYAELKATHAKLELELQMNKKELCSLNESLGEKETQLNQLKLNMSEVTKRESKLSNDLNSTMLQLDKANLQTEGLGECFSAQFNILFLTCRVFSEFCSIHAAF